MKNLILSAASLAVLCAPVLALAEETGRDVQFRFTLEETETAAGAEALYARIIEHSLRNCRYASNRAVPAADAEECAEELAQEFVAKINKPLLTVAANEAETAIQLAAAD